VELYPESNNGVCIDTAIALGGKPYKIWNCDIWKCPICRKEVASGFGQNPFAEHYEDDFQEKLKGALENPINRIVYDIEKKVEE
jgi:hypothetical protein